MPGKISRCRMCNHKKILHELIDGRSVCVALNMKNWNPIICQCTGFVRRDDLWKNLVRDVKKASRSTLA